MTLSLNDVNNALMYNSNAIGLDDYVRLMHFTTRVDQTFAGSPTLPGNNNLKIEGRTPGVLDSSFLKNGWQQLTRSDIGQAGEGTPEDVAVVYNDYTTLTGDGYGGYVYYKESNVPNVYQFMLVNAGTRGSAYVNANGSHSMDWMINAASGSLANLPFVNTPVQEMPAQYAFSAADGFLRFIRDTEAFLLAKHPNATASYAISGESQAGLANQIQITIANKLGYTVDAFGTNTLNLSNDNITTLNKVFNALIAGDFTAHYFDTERASITNLLAGAANLLSTNRSILTDSQNGNIHFDRDNGYNRYTLLGRTNDAVANIQARPSSAASYWMAPVQTLAEYIDGRLEQIQQVFPSFNLADLVDAQGLGNSSHVITNLPGLSVSFGSDILTALRADYTTQNHVIEGFLSSEAYADYINQNPAPVGGLVDNVAYYLRSFSEQSNPGFLAGNADYGFYTDNFQMFQGQNDQLYGYVENDEASRAKEIPKINVVNMILNAFIPTGLSWTTVNGENQPNTVTRPSLSNQILTPLTFLPQSLQNAYSEFSESILTSPTGNQYSNPALDTVVNALNSLADIASTSLPEQVNYGLYLRFLGLRAENQNLVLANKFNETYGFLLSKDDQVAIPDLNPITWGTMQASWLGILAGGGNVISSLSGLLANTAYTSLLNAPLKGYIKLGDYQDNNLLLNNSYNNTLLGGLGNDTLRSIGAGNDYLEGGKGNNNLQGGAGNDTYYGDSGDDVFIIHQNEGKDVIQNTLGKDNVILFSGGTSGIPFKRSQIEGVKVVEGSYNGHSFGSLELVFDSNNSVLISQQFSSSNIYSGIERFTFDDGDLFIGSSTSDLKDGTPENDVIYTLADSDAIRGGLGNDTLYGGAGNDYYIYNSGDGKDVINDDSDIDTLTFGPGILEENIRYETSGNDRIIFINGSPGKVTIKNHFTTGAIENIQFTSKNELLESAQLLTPVQEGTSESNYILQALEDATELQGLEGQDVIQLQAGISINVFGEQDQTLTYAGANSSWFGENDYIQVQDGENSLYGDFQLNVTQRRPDSPLSSTTIITGGRNTLLGGIGDDNIFGIGTVFGFTNNFSVSGQGNVLRGNGGNDLMTGDMFFRLNNALTRALNGGDDLLDGGDGDDLLIGDGDMAGRHLISNGGDDSLYGAAGNDYIIGDSIIRAVNYDPTYTISESGGNDLLVGGSGDDTLKGGFGDDTYVVNIGDGADTIVEGALLEEGGVNYYGGMPGNLMLASAHDASDSGGADIIEFGEDITQQNITVSSIGHDLLIAYGSSGNSLRIQNQLNFLQLGTRIETFKFSDGSEISAEDMEKKLATDELIVDGGSSDDYLYGTSTYQAFNGYEGNDIIIASSLGDTLDGGSGNDTLDAGTGNDTVIGGTGDDTFVINSANVVVIENLDEGEDIVYTSLNHQMADNVETLVLTKTGNISATGNSLDNTITGNAGNNALNGAAGNDTLDGGTGTNTLAGGLGDDTFIVKNSNEVITENLDEGTDTVQSNVSYTLSNNVENLTLTSGNNNLTATGNTQDNVITGNEGDTTFNGDAGNDTLNGNTGNDTYVFTGAWGQDFINDTDGVDTIDLSAITTPFTTSHLYYGYAEDEISDGTNTINWEGSTIENIITGSANDSIFGNEADNTIDTGSGNDELNGYTGNDTLLAADGQDTLWASEGDDLLNGGDGSDYYFIFDGWGQDTITDAAGTYDKLFLDTITADLHVNLDDTENAQINDGNSSLELGTSVIENITTGSGNDTIFANGVGNEIWSMAGDDYIFSGDGSDTIYGGAGNDTLAGGASYDYYFFLSDWGQDIVDDTAGNWDRVTFDSITSNLAINLNSTAGDEVSDGTNTINWADSSIEEVYAGQGNDTVIGNASNNALFGHWGNDTIQGGTGTDHLEGGVGNDVYLFAEGDGNDSIYDSGNTDTILFDSSLAQSEVAIWMSGGHLEIGNTSNSSDYIFVSSQSTSASTIERLELSNGMYLSNTDISQVISDMTAYATTNSISLSNLSDVKNDANLMAIVNAAWHS